ncbi:hypothetical protein ADK41_37470 [Streptomyces caelestis]|uniref:Uncharacterized protein n=1 Tax=Streptomyces caelestis TaxID=36816 RepID=A0A0M8QKF0_9ACTN|nr:hypothetical protein ADK41_37470 [Streptomyces caelestis]
MHHARGRSSPSSVQPKLFSTALRRCDVSSSRPFRTPVTSPAAYAAPGQVVSETLGRSTGTPSTSAWCCIMRIPESWYTASTTSCVGAPVRREEAAEGGHDTGAAVVLHACRRPLDLVGGADDAELAAEPLCRRAR